MALNQDTSFHRRKFPRRGLESFSTVLAKGQYFSGKSMEIGEGGIRVQTTQKLNTGQKVVVNLFILNKFFVASLAEILYESNFEGQPSYGLRFLGLSFDFRRHIRDYIAGKTQSED